MHDVLFAYEFPPMVGGIARWMEALALVSPPGSLTVSTGRVPGAAASDARLPNPVDRIAVPSQRLRTVQGLVRWAGRAARLAAEPTARFAWCDTFRPAGYVAHHAWRLHRLPYGFLVHGNDVLTLRLKLDRAGLKRRMLQQMLGDAAMFVANSHWTATQCSELLRRVGAGRAADGVRVVALATDPLRWRPDAAGAEAFRVARHLPAGRWLVTVARLVPYKGIDTAIAVLARLAPTHADLHYLVVGRGPQHDVLRARAEQLGVADRVHLLTDVDDAELPRALALGEVYLGLTRQTAVDVEGFGLAFLEAAASGLPVVAGATGGIPDAVADGETGVLVDPESVGDAADAVAALLLDSARARRMGDAGRERVLRDFTWPRVVADLRQIAARLGRAPR